MPFDWARVHTGGDDAEYIKPIEHQCIIAGIDALLINIKPSGRSISRILSNGLLHLCSHLSGQRVAALLGAAYPGLAFPTRGKGTCGDEQSPIVHRRFRPCLALLPAGVTWPSALRQMPVVSYTTFSPSPLHPKGWKGCLFLWPFSGRFAPLGVSPPRLLSDAVLYGVRTFLDPDNAGPRPPDQPEVIP